MSPNIPLLAMFSASILALSTFTVFVTGMFPVDACGTPMRRPTGRALVYGCILSAVALASATVVLVIGQLYWPYAVIAGGLALLVGPLVFQLAPASAADGPAGALLIVSANSVLTLSVFELNAG